MFLSGTERCSQLFPPLAVVIKTLHRPASHLAVPRAYPRFTVENAAEATLNLCGTPGASLICVGDVEAVGAEGAPCTAGFDAEAGLVPSASPARETSPMTAIFASGSLTPVMSRRYVTKGALTTTSF